MNTTTTANTAPDFAHSVGVVVGILKELREAGHPQAVLLGALKAKLKDDEVFVSSKRQAALKEINKQLGSSFSMSQVNKAKADAWAETQQPKAEPAKAIITDELHGVVDVNLGKQDDSTSKTISNVRALLFVLADLTVPELFKNRDEIYRAFLTEYNLELSWEDSTIELENFGTVTGLDVAFTEMLYASEHEQQVDQFVDYAKAFQADYAGWLERQEAGKGVVVKVIADPEIQTDAPASQAEALITPTSGPVANARLENAAAEATQENTTVKTEQTAAPAPAAEQAEEIIPPVTLPHVLKHGRNSEEVKRRLEAVRNDKPEAKSEFLLKLEAAGITDAEKASTFTNAFLVKYPQFQRQYVGFVSLLETTTTPQQALEKFAMTDAHVATAIEATLAEATAKPAAEVKVEATFSERALRSMRGNRETGFSSGVVAAATAIIGGAVEMVVRGGPSIGGAIGAGLGATAAYFGAEAAEGAMESETGRYILAGSIGLVAGGAGASLGRTVQSQFTANAYAEEVTAALPELAAPAAPVASTEGFRSMFGL